ncbi:MAG: TM0106 family RecB-like putative nuclease [Actinobacteria bacterium]|nr:TM0106 family RecB-like putative nuclease [Actinomycetota bacterium]
MRYLDGQLLCSATDLTGLAACRHLTELEQRASRGEIERPRRDDPFVDVLSRRGTEHEQNVLSGYGQEGIVTIDAGTHTLAGLQRAAEQTAAAMRAGARVIYQATFLHDGWVGHADFVERVDGAPSALGEWSYQAADSKLARSVKATALLQLAEYSEHITRIQGVAPRNVVVITGDRERHESRLADVAAYHRALKAEFVATVTGAPFETYPDKVDHCAVCRWADVCADKRRADDHLSLVAGIRNDQIEKLAAVGITTRRALAHAPDERPCDGIGAPVYERLRSQAALQIEGDGALPPLWKLVDPATDSAGGTGPRGFAALPEPSPGDLFVDLEGDQLAVEGGLEYLFGLVELVDGAPSYTPFWAHSREEERGAFEQAVDFILERRHRYSGMHVYHYAAYEPSAFKKLMGLHGTREDDVDGFLRGAVFVDLFKVVRQSVRLSTESYSLKEVEKLYSAGREGAVTSAGSSIVAYEEYLVDPEPHRLDEIAAYNRDDCESLVHLRDWLEKRRADAEHEFGIIPRPERPDEEVHDEEVGERAALAARLIGTGPAEALLGNLLDWHRREAKPAWWQFFARCNDYEPEQFVNDRDCIGGLQYKREIGPDHSSIVYEFGFEPQDHKFSAGDTPFDPATGGRAGTIVDIGDDWLTLKRGRLRSDEPFPYALIPGKPYDTDAQRDAIRDVAAWVADHGIDAPGPYRAVRDLLLRLPPRGVARMPAEASVEEACRVVSELNGGLLAVQGPPGAGKTFTGARMIVALLLAGRRVGVTATTHSAIGNLLREVVEAGAGAGVEIRAIQKASGEQRCTAAGVDCTSEAVDVVTGLRSGAYELAAGTAWLWSRVDLRESVDVLFVDEAGQMSLADVLAVGTAARNVVLLGDPQQLAHPSQGSHPDGAGASALQHVLGDHGTMPRELGLFLGTTWRMHPNVCTFISAVAYEDRLSFRTGPRKAIRRRRCRTVVGSCPARRERREVGGRSRRRRAACRRAGGKSVD